MQAINQVVQQVVKGVEIPDRVFDVLAIAFLALLLVACNGEATAPLASPAATFVSPVSVVPTPILAFERYTTTMELPDGRILPMYCTRTTMDSSCYVVFPNGEIMPSTNLLSWSPDRRFVMVCGDHSSQDASCLVYTVCDLVQDKCDEYAMGSNLYDWYPDKPHTLVYFYQSVYLGEPDQVVMLDLETGSKEVWLEACPDWYYPLHPRLCERLPTAIVGGYLTDLPDGAEAQIMIRNIDGNNHFGPMTWRKNGGWHGNLKNSPGKLYEVTVTAEGYTSIPLSYTIQVSGTKAYVFDAGQLTGEVADHLDFRFEKSE